jgi:hypothetical protein
MDNYFTSLSLMDTLAANIVLHWSNPKLQNWECSFAGLKKTCRGTYCAVEGKKNLMLLLFDGMTTVK